MQKMMFAKQLEIEEGRIELLGFRMVMLPAYTLTKFIEELYKVHGDEAFDIVKRVGKHHGRYATDVLGREHEIPPRRFIHETLDSSGILGLGKLEAEIMNFDEGKMVFRIEGSPFPEQFRQSNILSDVEGPVDHLQLGMLIGIASDLFDTPVTARETKCEFLGHTHCKLAVTTGDKVPEE